MTRLWQQPHLVTFLFWAAYAICFLPEMLGGLWQNAGKPDRLVDRFSYPVLVISIIAAIILGFTFATLWPGASVTRHQAPPLLLGAAIMLTGAAFRWYAIRVLGRFFTRNVAIRPGHQIIRVGPYRLIRHPSYTGGLITLLGLGLALDNWASLAAILAIGAAGYAWRIRVEEAALIAQFGAPYREYCAETKRLLPFIF